MLAPVFLLLLTSSQIQSQKLTTEENELNKKNCGVHFLGQPIQQNRLVKKSYGGREFQENEYPWTAVMNKGKEQWCSGVQISPRHILTAAHCVLDFDLVRSSMLCAINQSHSIVSVQMEPEDISVFIGGGRYHCHSFPCQMNKTLYGAKKITTKEFDMCNYSNDLALIELIKDVSESDSTPICMPNSDLQLSPVLYAAGSGYHRDSGGPLFQVNEEGRHILVGITSNGGRCTEHSKNLIDHYTDVRANLDWICKYSGVCPVEEESQF